MTKQAPHWSLPKYNPQELTTFVNKLAPRPELYHCPAKADDIQWLWREIISGSEISHTNWLWQCSMSNGHPNPWLCLHNHMTAVVATGRKWDKQAWVSRIAATRIPTTKVLLLVRHLVKMNLHGKRGDWPRKQTEWEKKKSSKHEPVVADYWATAIRR